MKSCRREIVVRLSVLAVWATCPAVLAHADELPSSSTTESSYTFGFEKNHPTEPSLAAHRFAARSNVRVVGAATQKVFSELQDYQLQVPAVERPKPLNYKPSPKFVDSSRGPRDWELQAKLQELRAVSLPPKAHKPAVQHDQVFEGNALDPELPPAIALAADYSDQAINAATALAVDAWRQFISPRPAYADEIETSIPPTESATSQEFPRHSFERDALVHF